MKCRHCGQVIYCPHDNHWRTEVGAGVDNPFHCTEAIFFHEPPLPPEVDPDVLPPEVNYALSVLVSAASKSVEGHRIGEANVAAAAEILTKEVLHLQNRVANLSGTIDMVTRRG